MELLWRRRKRQSRGRLIEWELERLISVEKSEKWDGSAGSHLMRGKRSEETEEALEAEKNLE